MSTVTNQFELNCNGPREARKSAKRKTDEIEKPGQENSNSRRRENVVEAIPSKASVGE
jgi:hypothetical protein